MQATQERLSQIMSPVQWRGRYFTTLCPFHDDSEPSFLVYENGAVCLSASCQRHATLNEVYAKVSHQALPNTPVYVGQNKLVDWESIPDRESLCNESHTYLLTHPEQGMYLRQRGLEGAIRPNQLGWWHAWITIPIFDYPTHRFLGCVLRATPALQQAVSVRYITPPQQSRLLYQPVRKIFDDNLQPIGNPAFISGTVYLVFGIFDAIALSLLGLPAITCTNITGLRPIDLQDYRCRIIVVPDRGEERKGMDLVAGLDWRGEVKLLPYVVGKFPSILPIKDPADYFQRGESELLYKLLTQ